VEWSAENFYIPQLQTSRRLGGIVQVYIQGHSYTAHTFTG
jgi:hypothetical protein